MIKKYLSLLLTFCLFCGMLQAQEYVVLPVKGFLLPTVQQKAKANNSDKYATWGYCEDNVVYSIGVNDEVQLSAAIFVPRSALGVYKNAKVAGVRIGLSAPCTDVSGFLIEGSDLTAKPKFTTSVAHSMNIGFNDLMFRVPYQIENDIIVGYTATGFNQIGFDGGTAVENANYLCINNEWGSTYKLSVKNGWGSVCIQLLLTGDKMPTCEMSMGDILTKDVEQNKDFELKGVVMNKTTTPVSNYEITCSFSDREPITEVIDHTILANASDTFSIAMSGIKKIGKMPMEIVISKVNGKDDENPANNTVVHSLNVVEEGCFFPQKVVIEEATSVACGFCPRGIVVMESMKKRFPDRFIGIGVHMDIMGPDPMIVQDYLELGYLLEKGLPNGIANRKSSLKGDPLFFESFYEKEIQQLAKANVVIKSVSEVQDKNIHIDVTTRYSQDYANAKFKLAFVLLENNVTGFKQTNYYSDGSYGSMGGFENLPKNAEITFNDVARGIWSFYGMDNSVPSELSKKVDYEYSYDMSVPVNIQDEKNLEVVVLLFDAESGNIVQADKMSVGKSVSIQSAENDKNWNVFVENGKVAVEGDEYQNLKVYSLNGVQVQNDCLAKGIYIVQVFSKDKMYTQKIVVE